MENGIYKGGGGDIFNNFSHERFSCTHTHAEFPQKLAPLNRTAAVWGSGSHGLDWILAVGKYTKIGLF